MMIVSEFKLLASLLILFPALLQVCSGMEYKNCFDCARHNEGRNFMCNSKSLVTTDVFDVACCDENDQDPQCWQKNPGQCSDTYNEVKHSFYNYCPLINSTGCGLPGRRGDQNMVIEASTVK